LLGISYPTFLERLRELGFNRRCNSRERGTVVSERPTVRDVHMTYA
jgi:hypothetical protein